MDVVDVVDGTVTIKPFREMLPSTIAAIKQITVDPKDVKVRMHDKIKALSLLCKIMGLTSEYEMSIAGLTKYSIHIKRGEKTGKQFIEQP